MADNNITPPPAAVQGPTDINFYSNQKKLVIILDSADKKVDATFDNGDDIRKSIRVELADYAANKTVVAGNQFPVASSNGDAGSITLTDSAGNPAALIDPARNGQANYLDSVAADAKNLFNETSATRQLNTDVDGPFQIKKGKLESNAPTGDDIYRSIDSQKENAPFVKRVQRVLIDNTHYNAENPFIANPGAINENNLNVATVSYPRLGSYGPKKYPEVTPDITENNILNIREMKRIGLLTLLAGAGDITPTTSATEAGDAEFIGTAVASSLVPGLGRLGVKFPTSRFDANTVVKTMKPDFVRPTNTQFLDGKTNYTFGNSNTPFAPFAGPSSAASIASATILITTVGGLLFAFSQARYRKENTQTFSNNTAETRHNFLGSSDGSATNPMRFQFLDMPKLKHDFFACLNEGIIAFFGFQTQPGAGTLASLGQVVAGAESKVIDAHGYFNTILRQIVRGTSDLIGGVGATAGVGQGSGYEPKADEIFNQLDPASVLERLKGQPIVKFINILVTIGDRMIDRQGSTLNGSNAEETISLIDAIRGESIEGQPGVVDPAILIAKNRLDEFNSRSTMAARNKRSLLALPNGFVESARLLGTTDSADPASAKTALELNNKLVTIMENRIDAETVKTFEDYLEKDYMPFYFQDLRTNEILSFHAFVGDLNESLNAEYAETEGYGRIGSVPIYKNTKRNIGFSFYVVSTSEEDFDEMWLKINRLAMMLFPQWSEGRRVNFSGNKFVQPFSQVPAASPLIRFRIGDLWKANYSKFSIARLFGLSADVNEFKVGDMRNVPSNINEEQISQHVQTINNRRQNNQFQQNDIIRVRRYPANSSIQLFKVTDNSTSPPQSQTQRRTNPNTFGVLNGSDLSGQSTSYNHSTTDWLTPGPNTELTVQDVVNDGNNVYLIASVTAGPDGGNGGARIRTLVPRSGNIPAHVDSSQQPNGERFIIPLPAGVINAPDIIRRQAIQEVLRSQPSTDPNSDTNGQDNKNIVQQFFSDTGENPNPVMKAFKSTEGRGMAGFIRTMSFDYTQSTWETEVFNGRAPKFLRIQIEFIPIWDVAPGLDHKGAMTAPVWNVGKIVSDYHGGYGQQQNSKSSFILGKQKLLKFV